MCDAKIAFDLFRGNYPPKTLDHTLVRNPGELELISAEDGRRSWQMGPGGPDDVPDPPEGLQDGQDVNLWVIDSDNVPYALECGEFGKRSETGRLKHSNLTGGGDAHCGGELVLISHNVIALNGCSGRYGPRSEQELSAVANAFRASGYGVWQYGWDAGTNRPLTFALGTPVWVE